MNYDSKVRLLVIVLVSAVIFALVFTNPNIYCKAFQSSEQIVEKGKACHELNKIMVGWTEECQVMCR